MRIPLSRPGITDKDIREVVKTLETPYLSLGPRQSEFQDRFASYIGTKYAEAVSSGTAGLHLVMRSFGITKGDEVITSPFSFIASSNSVLFVDARPVFSDIDPVTLNIDPDKIEEKITRKTRAILVVHVFGMPADMPAINRIAKKHGLIVIEDACEALGAAINGMKVGSLSDAAVFGFYPNKQITTGEGGMVVTDNKRVADACHSLKNQGRDAHKKFSQLGYNFRLSDISCALGSSQLSRIDELLKKRERVAGMYANILKDNQKIALPCEKKGYRRSWFVYVVRLKACSGKKNKITILRSMAEKGIECGDYFPAIHLTPFYRKRFGFKRGDFPFTEEASDSTIALPFHPIITESEIEIVSSELRKAVQRV